MGPVASSSVGDTQGGKSMPRVHRSARYPEARVGQVGAEEAKIHTLHIQ